MEIQKNIALSRFSTFHIGGEADYLIEVFFREDLRDALAFADEKKIPVFFLGGGSNIIFSDKGFRGLVIVFRNNSVLFDDAGLLTVESGAKIMEVFSVAKKIGRDFSVFSTIPGTLGGAIAGNAGLPDGEIGDYILSINLYDKKENKFIKVGKDFFDFGYRSTVFHDPNISMRYSIWSAVLDLPILESSLISEKAKKYLSVRKEKQPWGKTGGSFFKNPKEGASGYFLEKAGFKGFSLDGSGAFFSEKHANFMMNDGSATQKEIIELARYAQKKVKESLGVNLVSEVRMIDETGEIVII